MHVRKAIPISKCSREKWCQIPKIVGRWQQLHAMTLDVFLPNCAPKWRIQLVQKFNNKILFETIHHVLETSVDILAVRTPESSLRKNTT